MQLVAQGLKDQAIARRMGVSLVTVRRRVRRFRQKVGAGSRAQAIAVGSLRGWLDPEPGRTGSGDDPAADR